MHHPFISKLVEKSSNRFSLQAKIAKSQIKHPSWNPDITISRDPGSGGRVIAQRIAKKLGWELLDKRILSELAAELNIPEKEFANVDEHTRNWFADTFNSIFNPNYVSDVRYLKHLRQLLLKTGKEGDVVIVGRGANHIIPADKCLRVRITASFDKRVQNTMKHEHKSRAAAEEWVTYVQDKRSNFIKQYFGRESYNPDYFDLVVNTDYLNLNQGRDLIIDAYLAKFPSERRRLQDKL